MSLLLKGGVSGSFPSHLSSKHSTALSTDGRLFTMASPRCGCLCSMAETSSREGSVISLNQKPQRRVFAEDQLDNTMNLQRMEDPGHLEMELDHKSGLIAIVGKVNVGKSMLFNRLLGEKLSIVTTKPQTTRHCIPGICSGPNYQIKCYDTPGSVSRKMHKLDEMMVQGIERAVLDADCLLVVADICKPPEQVISFLESVGVTAHKKKATILVLNKKDLIKPGEVAKKEQWYQKHGGVEEIFTISAKFGHGVEDLKSKLVEKLPYRPAYYPRGIVSDHPKKFFVSESVRENIYLMYNHEIPYCCQVNVLNYHLKAPSAKDFIEVEILVEKESQRAILLGKGGQMLKALSKAARLDIQVFMRKEVYLEMKIGVKEDWKMDENLLSSFGYGAV